MTTSIYHYVYRITNTLIGKHYYGTRKSIGKTPKEDLGIRYYSSSSNKKFISEQKAYPDHFKYKVIRTFSTRESAVEFEIFLHNKYDVKNHTKFYNVSNQVSTGFDTSGFVTVKDKSGNTFNTPMSDPRYISGELVHINTGRLAKRGSGSGCNRGTFLYNNKQYDILKDLADDINCPMASVHRYCCTENDRVITLPSYCRSSFLQTLGNSVDIIGKSFKELGFGFIAR